MSFVAPHFSEQLFLPVSVVNGDNFRFRLRVFRRDGTVLIGTDRFPSTVLHFGSMMDHGLVGLHGISFGVFQSGGERRHAVGRSGFEGWHSESWHSKGRHSNQRHSDMSFGFVAGH